MNSRNSLSHQSDVFRQLRLPLIVLVTYAHSYGAVAEDYHLLTSDWNTYEFLKLLVSQTLVKVAVPVFFILSGYLFFANVKEWNLQVYRRKLLRRVRTLLVPYLFWNMLMAFKLSPNLLSFSPSMFWNYIVNAGCQTDWFGNEHLLTAPVNMPLWFLRDLMVVSVLTPIIYVAVRRLGLWLMLPLTVLYLSGICPFIPGLSAYAVYFFTFGAFLSIRHMPLLDALQRVEIPAYVLSLVFAVAMMLTYHTVVFSSLMLAFRLTGAVAVFCLASRSISRFKCCLPESVCASSYFVYLAHYVFFFSFVDAAFLSLLGSSTLSLSLHYLLSPLLKAIIFVGLYLCYIRLKHQSLFTI